MEYFEDPGNPTEDIPILAAIIGGSTAMLFHDASAASGEQLTVWLDSQEVLRQGDPVAGASLPLVWSDIQRLDVTTNGHIILRGVAYSASLQRTDFVIADITAGTVLVDGFEFLSGIPRRIESVFAFNLSPDGSHWSARVVTRAIRNGRRLFRALDTNELTALDPTGAATSNFTAARSIEFR